MPINYEAAKTLIKGLVQKMKSFRGNWEQNDPTADDYIKNRPFYTEEKEAVIIPEMVVSISGFTVATYSPVIPFEVGQTYNVLWNGYNYSCVASELKGLPTLGDFNFSSLPFCIAIDEDMFGGAYIASPTNGNYTVSVTCVTSEVHKIDKKYLPNMNYLSYKENQNLTYKQQETALSNVGDALYDGVTQIANGHYVNYSAQQQLNDSEKEFARNNIDAISENEVYSDERAYYYKWDGEHGYNDFDFNFSTGHLYYKIADLPCTTKYGITSCNIIMSDGTTYTNWRNGTNCYVLGGNNMCAIIVKSPGEILTHSINNTFYKAVPKSSGIYFSDKSNIYVSELSITFKIPKSGIRVNDANGTENTITVEPDGCISDSCIPETIARKTDILSPDWNQNDPEAADYVKNRPFYTGDLVETVLVEESTVPVESSGGLYAANFPTSFNAEFGKTYTVLWDGTAYECVCGNYRNIPIIGNQSIIGLGSDTGEPFLIFNESGLNETGWYSLTTDNSASHIISISRFAVEVVKIDEKYLPESSFTNAEWTKISNKIVDYKQQSLSLSASGEPINIGLGSTTSSNIINDKLKFEHGMVYKINGSITLHSPSAAGGIVYTLSINGYYTCSNGRVTFGSLYDVYYRKSIEVGLYSSSPDDTSYYGKLSAFSTLSSSYPYTFDINITVTAEAKQLPDICIGENIQRVGDDIILSSSTADSTKKFRITVDDSGKPTFTNSSDSTDSYTPTDLPSVTASDSEKFLRVSSAGEWVADSYTPIVLPPVTSSDSGKFLRVSSTGEWVAETIPNASGVSF